MLWSIDEVATYLDVSTSTVRRMRSAGDLSGKKVRGQWRFDPELVRAKHGVAADRPAQEPSHVRAAASVEASLAPHWAAPMIGRWRDFLVRVLAEREPDQVIVSDRRGSKIWDMMSLAGYEWGKNVWHSAAVKKMSESDLEELFGGRTVLVFDEIIQYGHELADIRRIVQRVRATAIGVTCVRRCNLAERGQMEEPQALACEDLTDYEFSERASAISRLTSAFQPPLDVGHLVIQGTLRKDISPEMLLERMARYGLPYVIWYPNAQNSNGDAVGNDAAPNDQERSTFAITLDRPQFFNAQRSGALQGFTVTWDGPCKVRFYLNPDTRDCFCSFIVYPTLSAPEETWLATAAVRQRRHELAVQTSFDSDDERRQRLATRVYSVVCLDLALDLLRDFVSSGVAAALGIDLRSAASRLDMGQFIATFGRGLGQRLLDDTRAVLRTEDVPNLFAKPGGAPVLFLRPGLDEVSLSHDVFACRDSLLKRVPSSHQTGVSPAGIRPIGLEELHRELAEYSQITIGRVLDFELDRGTLKPEALVSWFQEGGRQVIEASRGVLRGEFGPWFDYKSTEPSHVDVMIRQALGLGPSLVADFASRSKHGAALTGIQFNKLFANLQHDWREELGELYLGWRPFKYGPVPVVQPRSPGTDYEPYQLFLQRHDCLQVDKEQHKTQVWARYRSPAASSVPWDSFYRTSTKPFVRAHLAHLIELYAKIDNDLTIERPSSPRSSNAGVFGDPLVVLSAARNQRIAYICGWFEVEDWRMKAAELFSVLTGYATSQHRPRGPVLHKVLSAFAEPARLLHDKMEMYRSVPVLRAQLENLRREYPIVDVILEHTDETPQFPTIGRYPTGNLDWASRIMRAFSSLIRQVLTNCGYERDDRKPVARVDASGRPINAEYFLQELIEACPEVLALNAALRECIVESRKGFLTDRIADILHKTYGMIERLFEMGSAIPDPRPEYARRYADQERIDGLQTRFKEIQIAGSYAIAVADVRGLLNLARASTMFGTEYNTGLTGLLEWAQHGAAAIQSRYPDLHCSDLCSDCIVIAGSDAQLVYDGICSLIGDTTEVLRGIDEFQLVPLGLFRAGIAWYDEERGDAFSAASPGLHAHTLGDGRKAKAGTIAVSNPVYEHLSEFTRSEFSLVSAESPQGAVWERRWIPDRDMPSKPPL